MTPPITRRDFVRSAAAASAGAALLGAARQRASAQDAPAPAKPPGEAGPPPAKTYALQQGKIGKLEISRLILGGNLITQYNHCRDLGYVLELVKRYNTPEKIFETLALAEAQGINAISMHNHPAHMAVLRRYFREHGGKIRLICSPTARLDDSMSEFRKHVDQLVDQDHAAALYLWGNWSDRLVAEKRIDLVARAVELMKAKGVPAGVAAHDLAVVRACEEAKLPVDFYVKTFHHHNYPSAKMDYDSIFDRTPEETAEFMKSVEKPWIAFKVMAAGAIPPEDAFPHAFKNGADFVLAGMFDFEIEADVIIARSTLARLDSRPRPWRG